MTEILQGGELRLICCSIVEFIFQRKEKGAQWPPYLQQIQVLNQLPNIQPDVQLVAESFTAPM